MKCEYCDEEIKYEVYRLFDLEFCDFDCVYEYVKEHTEHNYLDRDENIL